MTDSRITDTPLYLTRGDTKVWTLTVTADAVAVPLTEAWLTVKRALDDADPGLFQLTSPSGGLVIGGADSNVVTITISPAQTDSLPAAEALHYDVQVQEASGRISTVARGMLYVDLDVTRSTA